MQVQFSGLLAILRFFESNLTTFSDRFEKMTHVDFKGFNLRYFHLQIALRVLSRLLFLLHRLRKLDFDKGGGKFNSVRIHQTYILGIVALHKSKLNLLQHR